MNPKLNEEKYGNAILYFTKYCNNNYLGSTKLNKLLYYFDFLSYRDRKRSVTNDKYVHKDFGPVPEAIDDMLVYLKEKNALSITFEIWKDSHKTVFENKQSPNMSVFDKYEQDLLQKICREFELWPTEKIVAQTHLEAPWFYSKPFEIVDYKYANSLDPFEDEATVDC